MHDIVTIYVAFSAGKINRAGISRWLCLIFFLQTKPQLYCIPRKNPLSFLPYHTRENGARSFQYIPIYIYENSRYTDDDGMLF